jgi:hypothetical protein
MASKNGSKRIKPARREDSASPFSRRRSFASPAPAPDIPRPLGELPPEAIEIPRMNQDLREGLRDERKAAVSARRVHKGSETAKRKGRSGT